jgi:N-acyl-D-aspartate/D-glutamate deacylase
VKMAEFDLVVRGGMIADGLGGDLFDADVAVSGDRIVAVGNSLAAGDEEIDAKGLLVTPGFVDIHTHYDGQATWENRLVPSTWHGVTTVAMGNCGVGFAPVREGDRDTLIELMEGIEDIPGTALHDGLKWNWESFEGYLDALGERSFDADVCAQLPHGPLRLFVMGERASRLEVATPDDIAQMRDLARRAAEAGALGFTTSRSFNHKSVSGDLTPSYRAREDELTGIALGLKDAGRGVLQWISDFKPDERAVEYGMIERIVRSSGRPMSISVGQTYDQPEAWRETMSMIAKARADGLSILAQVSPRPIGAILGLAASSQPFQRCPSFQRLAGKSLADKVSAMRDPAMRRTLLDEAAAHKSHYAPTRLFPMAEAPDYGQDPNGSVAAIAARSGRNADEVVYELLLEDDGTNLLFYAAVNYFDHDFAAIREMVTDPAAIMGLSDGGAHVGMIADASFPTTALTLWGRDDGSMDGLGLSGIIQRQTSATAAAVGLHDRGVIAPGMKADLNVIDLYALQADRPYIAFDLPSGAKRLLQRARGYRATIVSGAVTYRDGEPTGALPGRLVRGPQPAPR